MDPLRPMDEPMAAMDQRAAKKLPRNCRPTLFKEKMTPEKMTCGMRMMGMKLVARSLLGATAETTRPSIRPASDVRANEMYISISGGKNVLWGRGALTATTMTRIALWKRQSTPSTIIFENI